MYIDKIRFSTPRLAVWLYRNSLRISSGVETLTLVYIHSLIPREGKRERAQGRIGVAAN